jgi:uncharacterized membrane protein YhiD involved in acid resistance
MKLPETKYLLAVMTIVLIIVLYIMYKRKKLEKTVDGKKNKHEKRSKKTKPKQIRKTKKANIQDALEEDESESSDDQSTAQELYNLIHDRMASGMQSDEFLEVAGDMGDNLTYIEIKQLYNDAKNLGKDPSQSVTIDDYASVLSKRTDAEE